MNTIKPLPTEYDGIMYRSRTEARWAVFFTKYGIPFSYENEGYDLGDGTRYLPDFLLPHANVWFEVKPFDPTPRELEKARRLAIGTGKYIFIAPGAPNRNIKLIGISPRGVRKDGFAFGYAHEQGIGYIAENFYNAQHVFKLHNGITAPIGNYGCGAESELDEAGRYDFGWNTPKPEPRYGARVLRDPPRRRVIGRDW